MINVKLGITFDEEGIKTLCTPEGEEALLKTLKQALASEIKMLKEHPEMVLLQSAQLESILTLTL